MDDCLFCKIIAKKIPAKIYAESSQALAIADIHPQAAFHALILPKTHLSSLNALDEKSRGPVLADLFELANQVAHEQGFLEKGYRTVINTGKEGGQTVFHLHLHLMAKSKMSEKFGA